MSKITLNTLNNATNQYVSLRSTDLSKVTGGHKRGFSFSWGFHWW